MTSNRAPAEWPDVFGNPLLASAGLDRLAHHAETVVITGTVFGLGVVACRCRVRWEPEPCTTRARVSLGAALRTATRTVT